MGLTLVRAVALVMTNQTTTSVPTKMTQSYVFRTLQSNLTNIALVGYSTKFKVHTAVNTPVPPPPKQDYLIDQIDDTRPKDSASQVSNLNMTY